jgi:hypothetical protein
LVGMFDAPPLDAAIARGSIINSALPGHCGRGARKERMRDIADRKTGRFHGPAWN